MKIKKQAQPTDIQHIVPVPALPFDLHHRVLKFLKFNIHFFRNQNLTIRN